MNDARKWIWLPIVTLALGIGLGVAGTKCDFTPAPRPAVEPVKPKADTAVYVYEKDDTAIPSEVKAAMNVLNKRQGFTASFYEDDTPDGTGDVPEQFKVALKAAKDAGLPALVIQGGGTVLKVVTNPHTQSDVLEAAP